MLNFNHLYYFHVAATEGAIKAAADRLGVTQPTVSEQVRMLERALGVALFERTATGLRLTQAGRDAYEHTAAMFLSSERLLEALGRTSAPTALSLRIGVSAAMSRTLAADFLMPVLTVDHCRPSIRTGDFNELLRDLRSHELDLVIGESEPLASSAQGLESILIDQPTLVAVTLPEVEAGPDWSNLSLLEYRPSSPYHWEVDTFLKERGLRPKSMGEVDDAFLMLEAIKRGSFVAFVPRSLARDAVRLGRVRILATLPPTMSGVRAIYASGHTLEVARLAVERLVASAKENTSAD